jgi:hypothetical protein
VIRRPWSVLAAAGTAAHHGFELRAGVGLVFEPWLGRRGALAAWGVALPLWAVVAAAGGPRWDRALALWNGSALAGGLVHYALWPWAVRRGVPTLTEAEGLRAEQVPAYDAVLKAWVVAAAAALARETGPGAWRTRSPGWRSSSRCAGRPATTSRGRASRPAATPPTGARHSLRPGCSTFL